MKEIVIHNGMIGVPDVIIMEKLRFTPPSWKSWKSKFIEKSNIDKMTCYDLAENKIFYRVSYNKRKKDWVVVIDDII